MVCSRAHLLSSSSLGVLRRLRSLCPLQKPRWPAGLVHLGLRGHTGRFPWSMAGAQAVDCGASPAHACLGLARTLGLPSVHIVPTVSAALLSVCSRRQQRAASQYQWCGLLLCSACAPEALAEQHSSTCITLWPPTMSASVLGVASRRTSRAAPQHLVWPPTVSASLPPVCCVQHRLTCPKAST